MKLKQFVIVVLLIGAIGGGAVSGQDLPTRADLGEGWTAITPGGATICSRGTPYTFYAREGSSDNLLIEFQGGGACWNALTCGLQQPTFDETVEDGEDNPASAPFGIHDLANPDNPFADYDMVFIPYCTADVHMGAATVTYGEGDEAVTINHNGAVNARAALEWAYATFDAPESVFITGCSAGSLGASFHAASILRQYEGVRAAVLGDSAGGYRGDLRTQFGAWNTAETLPDFDVFAEETTETLSFNDFWIGPAQLFPEAMFAQYNTANDSVQNFFIAISGVGMPYPEALAENTAEIEAAVDNYVTYLAGGDEHCIIPEPWFYTYTVGEMRFVDWVAALAAGEPVESVACTDCAEAEEVAP